MSKDIAREITALFNQPGTTKKEAINNIAKYLEAEMLRGQVEAANKIKGLSNISVKDYFNGKNWGTGYAVKWSEIDKYIATLNQKLKGLE